MLTGVKLYAAIGILVLIAGLGLTCYGLYYKAKAAEARSHELEGQRDRAIAAVKAGEEANAKLRALSEALNAAIVERDKRAKALEDAKRRIGKELDEIKKTLDEADKACLDRSVPPAIDLRLRDGPDNPDASRNPASPPRA